MSVNPINTEKRKRFFINLDSQKDNGLIENYAFC
jgi:hypothetical protein